MGRTKLGQIRRNAGAVYVAAVSSAIVSLIVSQGRFLPPLIRFALPLIVMLWPSLALGIYLAARRPGEPSRVPLSYLVLIGALFGASLISLSVVADLATVAGLASITYSSPVSNEIDLHWPAVAKADYYEIYRSDASIHPINEVQHEMWPLAQPGVNSFADFNGLKPSTTYHYGIVAVLSGHKVPVGVVAASTNAEVSFPTDSVEREEPAQVGDGPTMTETAESWKSMIARPLRHLIPFILLPILSGEVLVRLCAREGVLRDFGTLAPPSDRPMIPPE